MKRILSILIGLILLIVTLSAPVSAADTSRSYEFDLTINGEHEVKVLTGDVLTVTLTLRRTDSKDEAEIYGIQDEIRYDNEFLKVVEGATMTAQGVRSTDIELLDR